MKRFERSNSEIAKAVGHTLNAVANRVSNLGIGRTYKRHPAKKTGEYWTSQETNLLISMWKRGKDYEAIASRIGRSVFSVEKQYQKLAWQGRVGRKTASGVEHEIEKLKEKLKKLEERKSFEDENSQKSIDTLRDNGYFVLAFRVPRFVRKAFGGFQ
jgi:hypothetical protein